MGFANCRLMESQSLCNPNHPARRQKQILRSPKVSIDAGSGKTRIPGRTGPLKQDLTAQAVWRALPRGPEETS